MRVVQIEPGPMPTLTASAPWSTSALAAVRRRDIAADDLRLRDNCFLTHLHAVEHALRMPVRRIDDHDVDAGLDQRLDALFGVSPTPTAAPTRSRPSSSLQAFGCSVDFRMSLTVISPRSSKFFVDDQHALEPVLVHQRHRIFARRRLRAP